MIQPSLVGIIISIECSIRYMHLFQRLLGESTGGGMFQSDTSQLGTRSTRYTVKSVHGQLGTVNSVQSANRYTVKSVHSQLGTVNSVQ